MGYWVYVVTDASDGGHWLATPVSTAKTTFHLNPVYLKTVETPVSRKQIERATVSNIIPFWSQLAAYNCAAAIVNVLSMTPAAAAGEIMDVVVSTELHLPKISESAKVSVDPAARPL
jgi:hypothetical protein